LQLLCAFIDSPRSHLHHVAFSLLEAESAPTYSKRECESFAALSSVQELPAQCQEYPSVKVVLQRRNKSNYAVAFAGMSPADASEAMTARETGKLTHAQFQRRLTTRHHAGKW
jgi:hypothetical protein